MAGQEDGKRKLRTSGGKHLTEREQRRKMRQLQDAITGDSVEEHQAFEELLGNMDVEDINMIYKEKTLLMHAVKNGDIWYVDALLSKGADTSATSSKGDTVLHLACLQENEQMVQRFVSFKHILDVRNREGHTALFLCADLGFLPGVKLLVEGGADCNIASEERETPLLAATGGENVDVIRYLVTIPSCDVNRPDDVMQTPLILAANSGRVEVVSALLSRNSCEGEKIDINFGTNVGPALFTAIYFNYYDMVRELIKHGADINLKRKGEYPLSCAICGGKFEIAHLLIESGCELNVTDSNGHTPLYLALHEDPQGKHEGTKGLVLALLEAGADISIGAKDGGTPLHLAASIGNQEIFDLLLNQGANPLAVTKSGDTVLHEAAKGGNPDIIKCLLQKGCCPNSINDNGCHALHIAVNSRAPVEVLTALVEGGSDLNLQERENSNTPLHQAVFWRNTTAAVFLINAGCDLAMENGSYQTALYLACLRGNRETVSLMLEKLGSMLLDFNPCAIPMHAAATEGHHDLVRQLVDTGYDINEMAVTGLTPVLTALSEANMGVCAVLLEKGASLVVHRKPPRILTTCCRDSQDRHPHFHLEPLFIAMQHRQPAMMEVLLQCMPGVPTNILRMLREMLLKNSNVRSQFSAAMMRQILDVINKALRQPRPLLELCRGVVREVVGCPLRTRLMQILDSHCSLIPNYICMTETLTSIEKEYEMAKVSRSTMRYAVL